MRAYARKDSGCQLRSCGFARTPSVTLGCRPLLCTGCFGFVLPSSTISGNSRKSGTRGLARRPPQLGWGGAGGSGSRGSPARRDPRDVILPRVRSAVLGLQPVGRLVSLMSASVDSTRPSSRIHPPRYCLTNTFRALQAVGCCLMLLVALAGGRHGPPGPRGHARPGPEHHRHG